MDTPSTPKEYPNFLTTRLERAYERTSQHWFPVNPALLKKVQDGIQNGIYDLDIDFLLTDLKTDFALLTYCLREMIVIFRAENIALPLDTNPLSILREGGLDKIKKILELYAKRSSPHSFDTSTENQSARLREAMISASTAETLAPGQAIDPEVGFSTALLRQLGLALIAWNYPTVYERALGATTEDKNLDVLLSNELGFSPQTFASFVVTKWGIAPKIVPAISDAPPNPNEPVGPEITFLSKICQVGEALARADNPDDNKNAEHDYEQAREAIEGLLGADGMRAVQEQVKKNCESYRTAIPQAFVGTDSFNPAAKIKAAREGGILELNPFIKGCSPYLKKALKELYTTIDRVNIAQDAIKKISSSIIPMAGFSGACVYVLDPGANALMPRLASGKLCMRTTKPIQFFGNSISADPVVTAYDCQTPIIEHSKTGAANDYSCICVGLGNKQRIGVLYVEAPSEAINSFDQNLLTHFKAIRKAIEDALILQ